MSATKALVWGALLLAPTMAVAQGTVRVRSGAGGASVEVRDGRGASVDVSTETEEVRTVRRESERPVPPRPPPAPPPAAPSAPREISVEGVGRQLELRCEGGEQVRIDGTDHRIALEGECGGLELTGSGNQVRLEAVASIRVTGVSNTVAYRRAVAAKSPRTSVEGVDNRIYRAKK